MIIRQINIQAVFRTLCSTSIFIHAITAICIKCSHTSQAEVHHRKTATQQRK